MSVSAACVRRAEEASGEISGILSRLHQQLSPARRRGGEDASSGDAETDSGLDHGSLITSLGEVSRGGGREGEDCQRMADARAGVWLR